MPPVASIAPRELTDAAARVLEILKERGRVSSDKYRADPLYTARINDICSQIATIGGDSEFGYHCIVAGERLGNSARGLEVFRITQAATNASWGEYDVLRTKMDRLGAACPRESALYQIATMMSELLKNRTGTIVGRYLLMGSLGAMATGMVTGVTGRLLFKAGPQAVANFAGSEAMSWLASGLGLLLAFPINRATRMTKTARSPSINPQSWWLLAVVATVMFVAFRFTEYVVIFKLSGISGSATQFGSVLKALAKTQWLFAMPLVFYLVALLRATSVMPWLSDDSSETIAFINEFIGNFGIPSVYWLAAVPVALIVSAIVRVVLYLSG